MDRIDHTDLILLLLGAPTRDVEQQGRCRGITRLEKLAFLLEEETDFSDKARLPTDELHFRPYHYGPYTREVYDAVALLSSIGLLRERRVDAVSGLELGEEYDELDSVDLGLSSGVTETPYVERVLELTDKGELIARVIGEKVGREATVIVSELKDRFGVMPLRQLLRYVYDLRPDMAVESRIRDAI